MTLGPRELTSSNWMKVVSIAVLFALFAGYAKADDEDEPRAPQKEAGSPEAPPSAKNNIVKLDPEALASSGIELVEVRPGSGIVTTRFPGSIEFNSDTTAVVQPPAESRLLEWFGNVGDRVTKGRLLARLENPQNLGGPIDIKAPLDGEIIERNAMIGDWVKPGDKIAVISEGDSVWAAARVREAMVGKVIRSESAKIRTLAFPDETFIGKLVRISASVDQETRTVGFVYSVPNPQHKLRSGMFAEMELATDQVEGNAFVPEEAIQMINGRPVVFVESNPGEFRVTPVRLGRKVGDSHEVLEGVGSAVRVVTGGSFVLKSEALRGEFSGDND